MCMSATKRGSCHSITMPSFEHHSVAVAPANSIVYKRFLAGIAVSFLCVGLVCWVPSLLVQLYATSTNTKVGVFVAWVVIQVIHRLGSILLVDAVYTVDEAVTRVSSSQAMTRIRSSVSASSTRLANLAVRGGGIGCSGLSSEASRGTGVDRVTAISAQECFLATETSSSLTLSDIKDLFRFVMDMNRLDFNKKNFTSTLTNSCRDAAEAITAVMNESRGPKASMSTPSPARSASVLVATAADADALAFCAVLRVFADWRFLRLVPDGYKRYSAGMTLGKRDLVQNINKIENAVHNFLVAHELEHGSKLAGRQLSSPTLRQLLVWERDTNLHKKLPRLADKSAASGLLWSLRQLQYQTSIFQNLLLIPTHFTSGKLAMAAAYQSTYSDYHGFFVKQIFKNSFDAAPDVHDLLHHMNGSLRAKNDEQDVLTEAMTHDDDDSFKDFADTSVEMKQMNPLEHVGNHVVNEWLKLERFLGQCVGASSEVNDSKNVLGAPSTSYVDLSCIAETSRTEKITSVQTAQEEMPSYVAVVQSLLDELDSLISELNMKDPTKC